MKRCKVFRATFCLTAFAQIASADDVPTVPYAYAAPSSQPYYIYVPEGYRDEYYDHMKHQPQAMEEYKQYASRPPASVFDSGVPSPQARAIKRTMKERIIIQPMPEPIASPVPVQQQVSQTVNAPPPVQYPVQAEPVVEEASPITGSVGFTTDYSFRGVTQTKESPAVQTGLEYAHKSGAYIGVWGSNVDFVDNDEASLELDGYGGYRTQLSENFASDAGFVYYAYPGANSDLNYDYYEFYLSGEYTVPVNIGSGGIKVENVALGASLNYSPEFFAESGAAYYAKLTGSVPFANGVTLDAHVGRQWIKDEIAFALPDYTDWSVGAGYTFLENYEVKLEYVDTNLDKDVCSDGCDAKAVATLTRSF